MVLIVVRNKHGVYKSGGMYDCFGPSWVLSTILTTLAPPVMVVLAYRVSLNTKSSRHHDRRPQNEIMHTCIVVQAWCITNRVCVPRINRFVHQPTYIHSRSRVYRVSRIRSSFSEECCGRRKVSKNIKVAETFFLYRKPANNKRRLTFFFSERLVLLLQHVPVTHRGTRFPL